MLIPSCTQRNMKSGVVITRSLLRGFFLPLPPSARSGPTVRSTEAKSGRWRRLRIERYFVPEEALREALLNALCHKQYQSGVPIQISVYEDKLYIANCGCLPENWTLENLMSKHASSPYNPNIAHVFYLAGFIESWGRGIEKICSACEKDGVPQPEYTINPGDIMIKFSAPEDRVIRSVTGRVTEKVTDKVTDTLDETSLKILNLLAVDPAYTTTFLAENLSLSRKTVSLRLKMLKENGLIERIGSDRKGYWKLLK